MAELQPLDCRVLLVEDAPETQRLFACILRAAGALVTVAHNGFEAIERALSDDVDHGSGWRTPSEPFDVILMDMEMPIMDGFEATRRLRAGGYTGPIVAVTSFTEEHDRQSCLDIGCTSYAPKPIERPELIELVRRHLHHADLTDSISGQIIG